MRQRPTDYRRYVRPSFLPVLAECAAAAQMSAIVVDRFGEPPVEDVAELGTDIHACSMLALLPLTNDVEAKPDTDRAIAKFPLFSGWDQACVRRYVEFACALVRKTRNDYPDQPVQVLVEHEVDGSVLGIDPGGQVDLLILVPFHHACVVDLKAGFLDQGEAADHDQLASYGVLAAATFKVRTVAAYLFQPRAQPAARASGARFAAAELKAQETWTRLVVEDATSDNPELKPGLHCTKCRALQRCPAAQGWIMRVKEAFEFIGQPGDAAGWGDLVDAAKGAEKFAKDAQASAKAHLVAGGAIERWKLQPGPQQRRIDAALAVRLARDAGVLDQLLEHVAVKTTAAEAVEAIAPAVTTIDIAPSLKAVKASSAAGAA